MIKRDGELRWTKVLAMAARGHPPSAVDLCAEGCLINDPDYGGKRYLWPTR